MKWQRLWLSGLMLCCGNVGAQEVLASPGARIRFTTRTSTRWVTGTVREIGRDSIRVDGGPMQDRRYATADLADIQVSLGRNHLAGMGAGLLIGGGIGGVAGFLIGLQEDRDAYIYFGPGASAVLLAIPGGGLGALIGGLVGTERWHAGVLTATRVVSVSSRGVGLRFDLPR